jgi:hypothetical protein
MEIRKEFATCVKKRAFKQTCRHLSSLTFDSRKNCFRTALLKNRTMSKQQCSQKLYCIVDAFTVLKGFYSAGTFIAHRFLAPFPVGTETPLSISVPTFLVVFSYIFV